MRPARLPHAGGLAYGAGMRTRDREQDWIEELGRRRLEALIAELTPPAAAAQRPVEPVEAGARDDDPGPAAPVGRHARRPVPAGGRVRGWLGDRVPAPLAEWAAARGDARLQHGHVGLLALVLAVAVLLGGWAWLRASGGPPAPAAAPVVEAPGAAATASTSTALLTSPSAVPATGEPDATAASAEVVVHVAGRVRRPGIVVLPAGSRVVDAVRRAGGFTRGVGPRSAALNLARPLVDGEQIVVGSGPGVPAAGPVATVPGSSGPSAGPLVSLNTADQVALESLPGVGPVTATAILQWRSEHGPFTAVEQLLEVSGIGEATLAEIEPHVTL